MSIKPMRKVAVIGVIAAASVVVTALMAQRPRLSFAVASVKISRNPPQGPRAISLSASLSHGTLNFHAPNLRNLILQAYDVQHNQVQGCPDWCDSVFFDVIGKTEDPNATRQQVMVMLQILLADRFQLAVRKEMRQVGGYALLVGKNGQKLRAAKDDEALASSFTGYIRTFQKMGISGLVNFIAGTARQPVVDETGFTGAFDFAIDLTPPENDPVQAAARTGAPVTGITETCATFPGSRIYRTTAWITHG